MITALRSEVAPTGLAWRRHGIGFWLAGYVFAITMAFSAVPAPLYVLYQARDHFGSLMVTVIFSVYAFGVAASLFGGIPVGERGVQDGQERHHPADAPDVAGQLDPRAATAKRAEAHVFFRAVVHVTG